MKLSAQVRVVRLILPIDFSNQVSERRRLPAERTAAPPVIGSPPASRDRLSESLSNGKHTSAEGCEVIWAGYLAAEEEVRCKTQPGDRKRREVEGLGG